MSAPIPDFYAVIPAGGIGSRLWPLSRADAPKFLHDLTGSGQSLLRATWDRLEPLAGHDRIAVVTGRAHRAAVEAELPGIPDANVFLESDPRDSTAAIGLAAAVLVRRDPDVLIGSFAADHVIRVPHLFDWAVRQAVAIAREGYICTIGIQPSEPSVGFGYIKKGEEMIIDGAPEAALVESFVEKPDLETAKRYFAERSYLWNAGMFISRADVLLAEIEAQRPELHAGLTELAEAWDDREARGPAVDRIWPKLERIAIDYSVAEPAAAKGRLAVVPGHFDWDDVGEWPAISRHYPADEAGNVVRGSAELTEASDNIVYSRDEKHLVALVGVADLIVVRTEDATLVCHKDKAQEIKDLVKKIGAKTSYKHLT